MATSSSPTGKRVSTKTLHQNKPTPPRVLYIIRMSEFLVVARLCSSIKASTAYVVPASLFACLSFLHAYSLSMSGCQGHSTVGQARCKYQNVVGCGGSLRTADSQVCGLRFWKAGVLWLVSVPWQAGRRVPSVPLLMRTLTTRLSQLGSNTPPP